MEPVLRRLPATAAELREEQESEEQGTAEVNIVKQLQKKKKKKIRGTRDKEMHDALGESED